MNNTQQFYKHMFNGSNLRHTSVTILLNNELSCKNNSVSGTNSHTKLHLKHRGRVYNSMPFFVCNIIGLIHHILKSFRRYGYKKENSQQRTLICSSFYSNSHAKNTLQKLTIPSFRSILLFMSDITE